MKENKNLLDNIDLGEEYIILSDYREWMDDSKNDIIYLENKTNLPHHIENIKRILKKGYGEGYTVVGWYEQETSNPYEKVVITTNLPYIMSVTKESLPTPFCDDLWDTNKKWLKEEVMIGIWEDVDIFSDYWKDYKNRYGIMCLDLLEELSDYSLYLEEISKEKKQNLKELNTRENFMKWYSHIKRESPYTNLRRCTNSSLKDWSYEDCNNIIPRNEYEKRRIC